MLAEQHCPAQERDDDRTAADHRHDGDHGVGLVQGVEIGEIGQHEEERDQRNGPSPVERGGRTATRPPEDADDDRHQAEQIEVAPALHEDRVETRHDIFVVQSAYDGGQSRHRDTEYPDVVTEIDPFAAARTAQQEEREVSTTPVHWQALSRSPKMSMAPTSTMTGRVALIGPTMVIGRCFMAK